MQLFEYRVVTKIDENFTREYLEEWLNIQGMEDGWELVTIESNLLIFKRLVSSSVVTSTNGTPYWQHDCRAMNGKGVTLPITTLNCWACSLNNSFFAKQQVET